MRSTSATDTVGIAKMRPAETVHKANYIVSIETLHIRRDVSLTSRDRSLAQALLKRNTLRNV